MGEEGWYGTREGMGGEVRGGEGRVKERLGSAGKGGFPKSPPLKKSATAKKCRVMTRSISKLTTIGGSSEHRTLFSIGTIDADQNR